jgi:hypothetical protein
MWNTFDRKRFANSSQTGRRGAAAARSVDCDQRKVEAIDGEEMGAIVRVVRGAY